jgi:ATP-binding cassette subfamily B protein
MSSSGIQLAVRSLQFVRPYRRSLVSVVVLALILATLSAIDPLLIKYLFDQLGRAGGGQAFGVAMAGLLVWRWRAC